MGGSGEESPDLGFVVFMDDSGWLTVSGAGVFDGRFLAAIVSISLPLCHLWETLVILGLSFYLFILIYLYFIAIIYLFN